MPKKPKQSKAKAVRCTLSKLPGLIDCAFGLYDAAIFRQPYAILSWSNYRLLYELSGFGKPELKSDHHYVATCQNQGLEDEQGRLLGHPKIEYDMDNNAIACEEQSMEVGEVAVRVSDYTINIVSAGLNAAWKRLIEHRKPCGLWKTQNAILNAFAKPRNWNEKRAAGKALAKIRSRFSAKNPKAKVEHHGNVEARDAPLRRFALVLDPVCEYKYKVVFLDDNPSASKINKIVFKNRGKPGPSQIYSLMRLIKNRFDVNLSNPDRLISLEQLRRCLHATDSNVRRWVSTFNAFINHELAKVVHDGGNPDYEFLKSATRDEVMQRKRSVGSGKEKDGWKGHYLITVTCIADKDSETELRNLIRDRQTQGDAFRMQKKES